MLAQLRNDSGYLPLHFAVMCQRGEHAATVVEILCRLHPLGAQTTSELWPKWLPLHCAARFHTGEHGRALIATLLTASAKGVREKDDNGRLPLHLAAMWQCADESAAVVSALLET